MAIERLLTAEEEDENQQWEFTDCVNHSFLLTVLRVGREDERNYMRRERQEQNLTKRARGKYPTCHPAFPADAKR
jgi:hypothetical protein